MDKVRSDLAGFNFTQKYARYNEEKGRRETWGESAERIYRMHQERYPNMHRLAKLALDEAYRAERMRHVLSSQRARQFGGAPVQKKNWRMYNCTVSFCDRPRFFQEAFWLLLCGCGVGFSIQKHHVSKLPLLLREEDYLDLPEQEYSIPDTIEGWADALGDMIYARLGMRAERPRFVYDEIRPKGAALSAGGKAPGPEPLRIALERVSKVLARRAGDDLRPIDCFDIVMHTSDAVLSGGVRRAATIAVFSLDDQEMAQSKTGDWYSDNPQRARANISALVPLSGASSDDEKQQFMDLLESTKQWGEPGFIFTQSKEHLYNPCVEIGMCPILIKDEEGDIVEEYTLEMLEDQDYFEEGGFTYESGWQACNLTEVNCASIQNVGDLLNRVRHATVLGTFQAGYTRSSYLGPVSEQILEREALLGVSLTGMSNSPEICFNDFNLRRAAETAVSTNRMLAKQLGLKQASRVTCVKPSGNAAVLLGCASGVHPEHSRRFLRRVQVSRSNPVAQYFARHNPDAVEDSAWSPPGADDVSLTFPVEVVAGSIVKSDVSAVQFLEQVIQVQRNWVNEGTAVDRVEGLTHNVSNTCLVAQDEWEDVSHTLWERRKDLTGVSLLGAYGDYAYNQPPFQAVYTPEEIEALGLSEEEAKKRISAWELWSELRSIWVSPDYSLFVEGEDNTAPQAEGACAGGACEFKPGS